MADDLMADDIRNWYYASDGVRHGPVALDDLRARVASGEVKPLDLVWQPAFGSEWRNAGQVRELFEPVPPPDAGRPPPADERPAMADDRPPPDAERPMPDADLPPPDADRAPRAVDAAEVPLSGVTGKRPSCLAAVSQAFERMVALLFRPFDISRWFSIGFCAWIAYIGTQSSINPNPNFKGADAASAETFKQKFDPVLDKILALPSDLPGPDQLAMVSGILAFGLLLALLFCRLRSRGDFMFLHRWYKPDASVSQCWWSARAAGRELFVWRVYFFLAAALLWALLGTAVYATVLRPYVAAGKQWGEALVYPAIGCATAALLLGLAMQGVAFLTKTFVVPVMYWHGVTASRAWLAVFSLCNQYPFAVLGYLVCAAGCVVAVLFAVFAFVVLTCCLGIIPLALPYVGSVLLLPYTLFLRGCAVCFLSQWRPDLVPDAETRG
jgi:hypothetical protein